ncbi:MAG: hypothetical protein ACK5LV_08645 [Lachnospirales bacterium]
MKKMISFILKVTVSFSSVVPTIASDFTEEDVTILDLYNEVDIDRLIRKLANGDKTAAEVVTSLEDDISSTDGVDKETIFKEVVGFLVAASAGGAGLSTYMRYKAITSATNAYADLFGVANWAALRRTKNFRITERIYRMYGL